MRTLAAYTRFRERSPALRLRWSRSHYGVLPVVVVLTLPAGLFLRKNGPSPPPLKPEGSLLFVSHGALEGDTLLRLNLPRLAGEVRLMADSQIDDVTLSPDGSRALMVLWADTNRDIFVADLRSGGVRQLTLEPFFDGAPRWSPDGSQVVFVSAREGKEDLYLMDADGRRQRRVTYAGVCNQNPEWSPDGTRIVFSRMQQNRPTIWLMNADGREQKPLMGGQAYGVCPRWSPDGDRIAFMGRRQHRGLCVARADGSALRTLAVRPWGMPSWSPDGKWLAYHGRPGPSGYSLNVIRSDGEGERCLINDPRLRVLVDQRGPAWSADGRWIAFTAVQGGNPDLYVVHVESGRVARLTHRPGEECLPVWLPPARSDGAPVPVHG